MSVSFPNTIRATVEVMATIETCVAAVVIIFEGSLIGGSRVPIMVPRLVKKVSPGPIKSVSDIQASCSICSYLRRRKIQPPGTTPYGP
jgi:hypothetical protein